MSRYFNNPKPFLARIEEQKQRLEADVAVATPGLARDEIAKKIRQLDIAAHLNEWLSSPGLQPPR